MTPSDGVIPSPNIWAHEDVYELENRGVDPDGRIDVAIRSVLDWSGRDVLDVGCGTGYHLPEYASTARSVVGLEPYAPLAARASARVASLGTAAVVRGSAARIPLAENAIDLAVARWAYFFGPGCEPGLAEVARVVRPGGAAVMVDNDATRSTFGSWFRRAWPSYDPGAVERFWRRQGWSRIPVDMVWRFETTGDFAAVLRIEFPAAVAESVLAADPGRREVDYAVNVWWRRY